MQDRPDAPELAEAVREFLETEILPTLGDHRLRFRTLVAMNGLGVLARELAHEPTLLRREAAALARLLVGGEPLPEDREALRALVGELRRALSRRIRAGDAPEGTLAVVKATVADKLRVASPRYRERYREDGG